MLKTLEIHNFVLIDQLQQDFSTGMTALTGETGAGKSIIIDAVSLVSGGRANTDMIRTGFDRATVEAQFELSQESPIWQRLDDIEIANDRQTLTIYRELSASGRNVVRINGVLVTLKELNQLGHYLVDIHGQFDQQELFDEERHIDLLDQFIGEPIQKIKSQYQNVYQRYRQIQQLLNRQRSDQQALAQRLDMLQFQVQELQEASLLPNEETQLQSEYERLNNYAKIVESLDEVQANLTESTSGNAQDALAVAMDHLKQVADLDATYQPIAEQIATAYYAVQEADRDLVRQRGQMSFDAQRLAEVNERLALIKSLERKYGESVDDVLTYQKQIENELADLQNETHSEAELEAELNDLAPQLQSSADELTRLRTRVGQDLAEQIHEQLSDLMMAQAVFSLHIERGPRFVETGQDIVRFDIQTNPGEAAKPLVKIASGGELSRLTLAMKTIFAHTSETPTVIFDEIDTGVSGRVARAIADKMHAISKKAQVFTITHLPQVAAVADQQFLIQKTSDGQTTRTTLNHVDGEQRVDAIAQMLSASEITSEARANARQLLTQ